MIVHQACRIMNGWNRATGACAQPRRHRIQAPGSRRAGRIWLPALLCGALLLPAVGWTAPSLVFTRLQNPPEIDGNVRGDSAWAGLPVATGFIQTQPNEGEAASQKTLVHVGYTADALYIAAVCHDERPERIIVNSTGRDSDLDESDSFLVLLDTFRDGRNGFLFGTNPAGVEFDAQVSQGNARMASGGIINRNWDTSWTVASRVHAKGWSTEFRIPFKSLRYGGGAEQVWGLNFQRNIRHNRERAFWAPLTRQHDITRISRAGAGVGLQQPPQRNLQVSPYGLGRRIAGGSDADERGADMEIGVDLKYSLTPSLTLDATWNTDFAQVEADEVRANLDRFNLFFQEKRPFFLENANQFAVGTPGQVELFFSRRVGLSEDGVPIPIEAGGRLSGKLGRGLNLGLLHIRTDRVADEAPRNDFSVARVQREFGQHSAIGLMFVNRQGDGSHETPRDQDHNRTYAVDGRLGIGEQFILSGWLAKTDTPGRSGRDHAFGLRGSLDSEKWTGNLAYTQLADNFNPEVGFLGRQAYRRALGSLLRRIRPDDLWGLHELRPHIFATSYWRYGDGYHESMFVHIDNHWEWQSGLEIHTGMNITHEGVSEPFEIVSGVTVPVGDYRHQEAQLVFQTDEAQPLSFHVSSRLGGRFGGTRTNAEPRLRYRWGEKFSLELSWNYNRFKLPDNHFDVQVGRLRATWALRPRLTLQALVQYDNRNDVIATNLRLAWLQTANAGLFLVYNQLDERETVGPPRREVILKFSRILNLL